MYKDHERMNGLCRARASIEMSILEALQYRASI
jgi:hypothetical protein